MIDTQPIFLHTIITYGKAAGAVIAIGAIASWLYKKLVSPVVAKVVHINNTVMTLATNHLPHIQESLDNQDKVLKRQDATLNKLESDLTMAKENISEFNKAMSETKSTVNTLHDAFLNHLENSSVEIKIKKKEKPNRR